MLTQLESKPIRSHYALNIRGVSKAFGPASARTVALNHTDFHAVLGQLTMLVGPSGCGKTTLLSIIAGTLTPDEGEVEVFGYKLHAMSRAKLTRFRAQHVGFIFQQFNLIPTLSVWENVGVPLTIAGLPSRKVRDQAFQMLERVGLKGREREYPLKLSGGQQQRVAIARALIHKPPLLICDEPTSALDRETGAQIMEMIRDIAREPTRCVVVVTHDARIYRYADSMAKMEDGRILKILNTSEEIEADRHGD